MTYTVNHGAVAKLLYSKTAYPDMVPIFPELNIRAKQVALMCRLRAPKRTGRLSASIVLTSELRMPYWIFKIEALAPYSLAVHRGTRPHEIRGDMEFRVAGRLVHTRVVHHPGTKPNPWMREQLPWFMRGHESSFFVARDRAAAAFIGSL